MKKVLLYLILTVFCASCASVEGEIEDWAENLKKIETLSTTYPGFAKLMKAEAEKAKKVMEEAKKISEEEKKLEKLEEANDIINCQMVRDLTAIQGKIDRVNDQIKKAQNKRYSSSELKSVERAIEKGRLEISNAESIIGNEYSDLETATKALRDATSSLISAASSIGRYTKTDKKKKNS